MSSNKNKPITYEMTPSAATAVNATLNDGFFTPVTGREEQEGIDAWEPLEASTSTSYLPSATSREGQSLINKWTGKALVGSMTPEQIGALPRDYSKRVKDRIDATILAGQVNNAQNDAGNFIFSKAIPAGLTIAGLSPFGSLANSMGLLPALGTTAASTGAGYLGATGLGYVGRKIDEKYGTELEPWMSIGGGFLGGAFGATAGHGLLSKIAQYNAYRPWAEKVFSPEMLFDAEQAIYRNQFANLRDHEIRMNKSNTYKTVLPENDPIMGKTTAAKTNPNLFDFDNHVRGDLNELSIPIKKVNFLTGLKNIRSFLKQAKDGEQFRNSVYYPVRRYMGNASILNQNFGGTNDIWVIPKPEDLLHSTQNVKISTKFKPIRQLFAKGAYSPNTDEVWLSRFDPSLLKKAWRNPNKAIQIMHGTASHEGTHLALNHLNVSPSIEGNNYYISNTLHPLYQDVLYAFSDPTRDATKWMRNPEEFIAEMNKWKLRYNTPEHVGFNQLRPDVKNRMIKNLSKRFNFTPEDAEYIATKFSDFGYKNGGKLNS